MRIKNLNKGRDYQLAPDTTLQIERTNPFFNEYGEQSLPVDLPDTPLNRDLTGHPEDLSAVCRPDSNVEVEIIDGDYHVRAQQRVLSARRNDKISTSYLLAQSELYAVIGDTQLMDVFGSETVPGTDVMSLDDKIAWLDGLKDHNDPNFDIFPVAMNKTDDSGPSLGYKLLNARGVLFTWMSDPDKQYFYPYPLSSGGSGYISSVLWLNAEDRTTGPKIMNDTSLNLQKGYYMTPFVRAIHVLKTVILHFGYTLVYDADVVIDKMVFLNNTIDSIVTGSGILYSDLVPDCSCSDLLDLFRYKFNVEFVCDAAAGTVTMLPFAAMLRSVPVDLTSYLTGHPAIEYRESYRRLVLSPSGSMATDVAIPARETLAKHFAPRWDALYGGWVKDGHQGYYPVTELIADGTAGYNIGGELELEVEELKSPDKIPSMVSLVNYDAEHEIAAVSRLWTFPYIGDERALHSRMSDDSDDPSELQERPKLDMMLLLPYNDYRSFPRGTLTNWDYYRFYDAGVRAKINSDADYSLCYHGSDGLFKRHWKGRDDLLRNALNKVRATLLLPAELKMAISPLNRVLLRGSMLLVDTLTLTLGQDDAQQESAFLTSTQQEPVSHAVDSEEIIPATGYHWELKRIYRKIEKSQYDLFKSFLPATDYLFNPSRVFPAVQASEANAGDECCIQYQFVEFTGSPMSLPYYPAWDERHQGLQEEDGINDLGGILVNTSGHTVYVHVESKLVSVADQ